MTYGGSLFAAYYNAHRSRLPAGYRKVEYIESTGAQFIDTGFQPASRIWVVRFQFLDGRVGQLMGASPASTRFNFGIEARSSNYFSFAYHTWKISSVPVDFLPHVFRMRYNVASFSVDEGPEEYNTVGDSRSDPIYIFSRANGQYRVKSGRCYFSEIYADDMTPVQNLVPCVRIADSKPGMYDLCGSICPLTNSPFYVNSGTGADFLWGELS